MPAADPEAAAAWLTQAKSDLALARIAKPPEVRWNALCFHAQQAAEKALKAVFIASGFPFQRTHDLGVLIDDLRLRGIEVPDNVGDAWKLTVHAVDTRYPGWIEEPDEETTRAAVEIAGQVVTWAAPVAEAGLKR